MLLGIGLGGGVNAAVSCGAFERTIVAAEGLCVGISAFPARLDDRDIALPPVSPSVSIGAALASVFGTAIPTVGAAVLVVGQCWITGLGREPELGTGEGRAVVGELGLLDMFTVFTGTGVLVSWCRNSPGVTGDMGGGGGGGAAAAAGASGREDDNDDVDGDVRMTGCKEDDGSESSRLERWAVIASMRSAKACDSCIRVECTWSMGLSSCWIDCRVKSRDSSSRRYSHLTVSR